jgi:predicted HAD superfamily Cof-like phosphohydrolase
MFVEFGWDFDEAFKRVHESNMSKLDEEGKPIRRQDGKILKGPNYQAPDLRDLV